VSGPLILAVVLIVLVLAVAVVAWRAAQRGRSERLREQFGPEYERAVERAPDRGRAEADLQARAERIEALDIRPLSAEDRDAFAVRWRAIQAIFVDDPPAAVGEADTLIGEVMRARGYPVGDFEQRAADVSVNHPQMVDHYRTAHRIAARSSTEPAATEDLRQAFVLYRALFSDLLETGEAPDVSTPMTAAEPEGAPAGAEPATSANPDEPIEPVRRPS